MSPKPPARVELHLPAEFEIDVGQLTNLGAREVFPVTARGFDGLAETIVTLVGSLVAVVRTVEWVRARTHRQMIVDLRRNKVRVRHDEIRNGVTVIIDQKGEVHRYAPNDAPQIEAKLRRLLS